MHGKQRTKSIGQGEIWSTHIGLLKLVVSLSLDVLPRVKVDDHELGWGARRRHGY